MIVVFEKHSPRKCRLFTSRGCVLTGNCIYTKEIKRSEHLPVFLEQLEMNDTKYFCR